MGSWICVTQRCGKCEKKWVWESQPYVGSVPEGNLAISCAILYSGSLPSQAFRIFEILNCATTTLKTFFRHQRQFLFPAINSLWEERQQSLLLEIKSGSEPLDLAGDGRADSPGHSAKYGSYNVIDLARSKVVDFKLVQVSKYTIHSAYYLWILSIW